MRRKTLILATMICLPALSACSTLPRAAALDIPEAPQIPPDSALELCPSHLQTLPIDRPVEQSEGWQVVIGWAEDYHTCKTRHAYLAGWIAGQISKPVTD